MGENSRIAKNTVFLYFRMLLVMGVSLFTSRVVLQVLGVDDFGLYNVIGGIVVMLGFINNCAAAATSRFLTFSLGEKKEGNEAYSFSKVFSTSFYIHLAISVFIIIVAETVGLWYFNHKLVIPDGRYESAMWVYQISILNILVSFTQVPYNASIIAHEKMNVYAFVGIYEAIAKLLIAYCLTISNFDNLILYSCLIFGVSFSISIYYRYYCVRYIGSDCKLIHVSDKTLAKKLLSFSGWDMIGNFGASARSQGVNILLNLFCGPAVNAARGVAYQVEAALYMFTTNFLQASRPAIIKHYASGDIDKCLDLLYNTGKYASLLFSSLAIPFIIESDKVLSLWLVNPPEYSSIFLQIVLANYIIISINNTLQIGVHATGDVKRLNIFAGSKVFIEIPAIYLCLRSGMEPYSAFVVLLAGSFVVIGINLWVLKKSIPQLSYYMFICKVLCPLVLVCIVPTVASWGVHSVCESGIIRIAYVFAVYWALVIPIIWKWVISEEIRAKIISLITHKLQR